MEDLDEEATGTVEEEESMEESMAEGEAEEYEEGPSDL